MWSYVKRCDESSKARKAERKGRQIKRTKGTEQLICTLTTLMFDCCENAAYLLHWTARPASPPCCKALLLQCGALKTHTVHSGPAISDLLCACAVFHFILQLAGMPLQEDTAKSPRSGHTAAEMSHTLIITHTHHVLPLCCLSSISGNFTLVSLRLRAASIKCPLLFPAQRLLRFIFFRFYCTFCVSLLSFTSL